jgi:uncharacterized membrane protein YfhO
MLVLSEMYSPGWHAYIDGKETPVYAADAVLRSIHIPAGEHQVEFRYEPASLRFGIIISVVTGLAILAIFALFSWRAGASLRGGSTEFSIGDTLRRRFRDRMSLDRL